jgi:hypothetical protein
MITLEKGTYFVSVTHIMQSQIQRLLTNIWSAQIRWRLTTGSSFMLFSHGFGVLLDGKGVHTGRQTGFSD